MEMLGRQAHDSVPCFCPVFVYLAEQVSAQLPFHQLTLSQCSFHHTAQSTLHTHQHHLNTSTQPSINATHTHQIPMLLLML